MSSIRKRPWNRVNLPVYSVSSWGLQPNMHICTYVSAVSMVPKRMMVAIYHGTLTLENVVMEQNFVLQLLAASQYNLVRLLGKQSGRNISKTTILQQKNLLMDWKGVAVLKEALAFMYCKVYNKMEAGDHTLFLCDVVAWKNNAEGEPLTTHILSEKSIIRV